MSQGRGQSCSGVSATSAAWAVPAIWVLLMLQLCMYATPRFLPDRRWSYIWGSSFACPGSILLRSYPVFSGLGATVGCSPLFGVLALGPGSCIDVHAVVQVRWRELMCRLGPPRSSKRDSRSSWSCWKGNRQFVAIRLQQRICASVLWCWATCVSGFRRDSFRAPRGAPRSAAQPFAIHAQGRWHTYGYSGSRNSSWSRRRRCQLPVIRRLRVIEVRLVCVCMCMCVWMWYFNTLTCRAKKNFQLVQSIRIYLKEPYKHFLFKLIPVQVSKI